MIEKKNQSIQTSQQEAENKGISKGPRGNERPIPFVIATSFSNLIGRCRFLSSFFLFVLTLFTFGC